MLYYPVLETGAAAQYPMVRLRRWQTLETRTQGGHVARGVQPEARRVHWELDYEELTDGEAGELTGLFEESMGGLRGFVFVDPLANLIRNSERPGEMPWARSEVEVTGSGRGYVVTNVGQGRGTLGQSLALPPGGAYCLSCRAQAEEGQRVGLRLGGSVREWVATGAWQRLWLTAEGEADGVTFCALELPAGGAAGVDWMQLERQAAPSGYRPGGMEGGVYPETRFAQESLDVVARGPNRNGVRVRLVSRLTE